MGETPEASEIMELERLLQEGRYRQQTQMLTRGPQEGRQGVELRTQWAEVERVSF